MRNDLTDITLVLDRSGSMQACRDEAENGVNHFIEEQKKQDGEARLTLVQFDTACEFVHRGENIQDVPRFTLVPRGMTALLDAVGRAINETGERLSQIPEDQRPGLVAFVIVTDGLENSSHEFTKSQIKLMVERQSNEYSWQFTFLGANQDAFAEAGGMGIGAAQAATYTPSKSREAYENTSDKLKRMRAQASRGEAVRNVYTDEERREML